MAWSGDANAKIDVAAALKGFDDYTNAIYATAKGDKDIIELIDRFADTLAEWRESLESFRPAAAAAAEMKRSDSALRFSSDGFIEA